MQGGRSRAAEHGEKYPDEPLPLPDVDTPELVGFLLAAGPTMAGAMGEVPLSSQELTAWADGNDIQLTPWEFSSILEASAAYASEKYAAKDVARPSPTAPELDDEKRKAIARNVRSMLRD